MAGRCIPQRTARLEEIARDVTRLADASMHIRSAYHYDDCEEEADRICKELRAIFRRIT